MSLGQATKNAANAAVKPHDQLAAYLAPELEAGERVDPGADVL